MLHILLRTKIQNFFLKDINKNFYSLKLIGNFGIIKIYIKKEIHVSTEDTKTKKSTSIKKINGFSTVDASTQNSDDDVIIRVRDFAARAPWKTQKIKIKTLWHCKEHDIFLKIYKTIIENAFFDVNFGYLIILEMRGVGFKVFAKDGKLTFNLGYSHQVFFELPYGITSKVLDEKNTIFYLFGNSRDLVTATAFEICSLKKKDAYKGKGINFYSAILKLKEGKSKKKT